MNRRNFLRSLSQGSALAGLTLSTGCGAPSSRTSTPAGKPLEPLKITKVRAFTTAPSGARLVVLRVETNEPGLYGLGCGTFNQRPLTVVTAVNEYLDPFLRGSDPDNIEDLWQAMFQSSYWRNGPVLMNALSGVDMALWDIKGKRAGMPVYQLFGGKCRAEIPVYRHVTEETAEAAAEGVRQFMAQGIRHFRVQLVVRGRFSGFHERGHFSGPVFEPNVYRRQLPRFFERLRELLGDDPELIHDIHEKLHPIQAIGVAKDLEPFRLFFLEDPVAPEDIGYLPKLRQQTSTPIAMGELFNNPSEWVNLIKRREIDFIRCHLSQIGGISVARKVAALCDFFRVRTAWHGPSDLNPVGHAANLHVDSATWNFGIQEIVGFNDAMREVFPGTPTVDNGTVTLSARPGLGIDFNEAVAANYPISHDPPFGFDWGRIREPDGTIRRP